MRCNHRSIIYKFAVHKVLDKIQFLFFWNFKSESFVFVFGAISTFLLFKCEWVTRKCSIAYFYMVGSLINKVPKHYIRFNQKYLMQSFFQVSSWGGYVFLINLIPLHVFTLMICGRYSHKVYVAYSTVYSLGTILSMQISFVGFQPVQTSEHMMVRTFQ